MSEITLLWVGNSLYIYIDAFSKRFYTKRLTYSAFRLYIFVSMCVPWELNPQPFALLTQCSTTEPQEKKGITLRLLKKAGCTIFIMWPIRVSCVASLSFPNPLLCPYGIVSTLKNLARKIGHPNIFAYCFINTVNLDILCSHTVFCLL